MTKSNIFQNTINPSPPPASSPLVPAVPMRVPVPVPVPVPMMPTMPTIPMMPLTPSPSLPPLPLIPPSTIRSGSDSSGNETSNRAVMQDLSEMWYVIFMPILCFVLFFILREMNHRQERNDPNSNYSRRRRERELSQLRRIRMQALIQRDERDHNGYGSRRRWNAKGWMSPARLEEKKNYILNNICVEIYKHGHQNDIEKNGNNSIHVGKETEYPSIKKELDENTMERSTNNGNNGIHSIEKFQEVISNVIVDIDLWASRPASRATSRGTSRPNSSKSLSRDDICSASSSRRDVCAICIDNFVQGDKICKSNYFIKNHERNSDNNDRVQELEKNEIFNENAPPHACGHTFHVECMVEWLMKARSKGLCPLCRCAFLSMEEFHSQERLRFVNNNNENGQHGDSDGNDGTDNSSNGENVNRTLNNENNSNGSASSNINME